MILFSVVKNIFYLFFYNFLKCNFLNLIYILNDIENMIANKYLYKIRFGNFFIPEKRENGKEIC